MNASATFSSQIRLAMFAVGVSLLGLTAAKTVRAFTPEDPVVKAMIDKGVKNLIANWHDHDGEEKLGADCLCAMALVKAGVEVDHPRVQQAIKTARAGIGHKFPAMYSPMLACIFLCEVDPQNSRQQIEAYLRMILGRQQPGGAWNYEGAFQLGDTSQSQYGALSLWYAKHHKFKIPLTATAKALIWFIRAQGAGGGWVYNPTGGGLDGEGTHSLTAAGLGSVYVLADSLGFKGAAKKKEESLLPPDVRLVKEDGEDDEESDKAGTRLIPGGELTRCQLRGNQWFNQFFAAKVDIENKSWTFYYLYGLERYMSFREKFEGTSDPSPAWYNNGVNFLRARQDGQGGWGGGPSEKPGSSTAFAILFLTRSTKKAISHFETKGQLVAVGPIRDTGKISRRGDRIVSESVTKSVTELLDAIENSSDDELGEVASAPLIINFTGDANVRAQQMSKLRKLMLNDDWKKRRLAVRTLSRERELDNIPVLIYALSDPDTQVVETAREGLRFISRKVNGIKDIPEPPAKEFMDKEQTQESKESKAERLKWVELAQGKWKTWYRTIRPDAEFFSD